MSLLFSSFVIIFQVWSIEVWLNIILCHLLYKTLSGIKKTSRNGLNTIQIFLVSMYNHHAKTFCLCHSIPWTFFQLLSVTTFIGAGFCFGAFCFKSMYAFLAFFAIGELLIFATQVISSLMPNRFDIVSLPIEIGLFSYYILSLITK